MTSTTKKSTGSSPKRDVIKEIDDLEDSSDEPNILLAQQLIHFFERFENLGKK